MNPALILGGVNAALSLLEQFEPELRAAINRGEISVEHQVVVHARMDLIRSGKLFAAVHWQLPPTEPPTP